MQFCRFTLDCVGELLDSCTAHVSAHATTPHISYRDICCSLTCKLRAVVRLSCFFLSLAAKVYSCKNVYRNILRLVAFRVKIFCASISWCWMLCIFDHTVNLARNSRLRAPLKLNYFTGDWHGRYVHGWQNYFSVQYREQLSRNFLSNPNRTWTFCSLNRTDSNLVYESGFGINN